MTTKKKSADTQDAMNGLDAAESPVEEAAAPEAEPALEPDRVSGLVDVDSEPEEPLDLVEGEGQDIAADDDLSSDDSLTFSNGVIEKIVAIAVRDVPGVLGMKGGWLSRMQETFGATKPTKGVTVEVMPDNTVRVNISVFIEYGVYAPEVFENVKKVVVKHVTGMTGLDVSGVNLRIEDVLTPEEYNGAKERHDEEQTDADAAEEDAE